MATEGIDAAIEAAFGRSQRWPRLGRAHAVYYAVCVPLDCLGIVSMFQENQA